MRFLYGTAWKEDDTARCVGDALEAGFRGIDTANQRRHYHEAKVGEALHSARLSRSELFLQTKFTFKNGQDQRLPYDPQAPVAQQVEQSCHSSLEHLKTDYLDSYVLHGPSTRAGWTGDNAEAWAAMEQLHQRGLVKALGVSNVSVEQLEALCEGARVQPRYVQNRCYARTGWDAAVRRACQRSSITYQGFSLLTANPEAVRAASPIARAHAKTPEQIIFAFALSVGMLPLTGTTDPHHMRQDLEALSITLGPQEVAQLTGASSLPS
jgi:diketogulonate reductase-like aldo/keto reductase